MNVEASKYLAAIGRRGGKAGKGKAKARTKAQARKAAMVRWRKASGCKECELIGKRNCPDHGGEPPNAPSSATGREQP